MVILRNFTVQLAVASALVVAAASANGGGIRSASRGEAETSMSDSRTKMSDSISGGVRGGSGYHRDLELTEHHRSLYLYTGLKQNDPKKWTTSPGFCPPEIKNSGDSCTVPSLFEYMECFYGPKYCVCRADTSQFNCQTYEPDDIKLVSVVLPAPEEPAVLPAPEQPVVLPAPVPEQPIGGETDEFGCLTAAGFEYCESLEECIRPFETECPPNTDTLPESTVPTLAPIAPVGTLPENPSPTPAPIAQVAPTGASEAACSANADCFALGLEGDCCPSPEGIMLGCCDGSTLSSPVTPTEAISTAPAPAPTGGSDGSGIDAGTSCPDTPSFPGDGTFCPEALEAAGNPPNLKCTFPDATVVTPSGETTTAVCDCKNLGPDGPQPVWTCNGTVESNPAAAPTASTTGGSCPATEEDATGNCCDSLPEEPGPGVEASCMYGATVCECPGQLEPETQQPQCETTGWFCRPFLRA